MRSRADMKSTGVADTSWRGRIGRCIARSTARLAAAMALALGAAGSVAHAQDMSYVRDLPTPAEIATRFAVADKEQSLGRQCAVLDMLWRGTRFFTYKELEKPEMRAAQQRYLAAIAQLRARYAREVRPLDTDEAQRHWRDRLCANAPDGVHPITGKPDASFPGLKQRVTTQEVVALFKPSVQLAYARWQESDRRAREMSAAMQRESAARREQAHTAVWFDTVGTLATLAAPVVGLGILALLAMLALSKRWSFDAARGELRIGVQTFALRPVAGTVIGRPTKSMETVVTGGGGGGGPNNAPVSVSISSHTIVHDQLFIRDTSGQTHALKLQGWDFPCDEGHRVVAAWLERGGKSVGGRDADPLLLGNHTVKLAWTNREPLMQRLGPLHPYATGALLIAAAALTAGVGLLLVVPLWIWLSRLSRRRADDIAAVLKPWAMHMAEPTATRP